MVIFNSYVKLPEGNHHCNLRPLLLSMSPWPQSQGIFLSHFVDDLKFRPLKKKTIEGDNSPIFIRENKPNVSNHQHCYVSFFAIRALLGFPFLMTIPLELNDLVYRPEKSVVGVHHSQKSYTILFLCLLPIKSVV